MYLVTQPSRLTDLFWNVLANGVWGFVLVALALAGPSASSVLYFLLRRQKSRLAALSVDRAAQSATIKALESERDAKSVLVEAMEADLQRKDKVLGDLNTEVEDIRQRCFSLESRLPEAVLRLFESNDYEERDSANLQLRRWLANEGPALSRLLCHRAEWAAAHAVSRLQPAGIFLSASYASAAMLLWPDNQEAKAFWQETSALQFPASAGSMAATRNFDDNARAWFHGTARFPVYLETTRVGMFYAEHSLLHLALIMADAAFRLLKTIPGRTPEDVASETSNAMLFRAEIFGMLDRNDPALEIAKAVLALDGVRTGVRLRARYVIVRIIGINLKKAKEVLPEARSLVDDYVGDRGPAAYNTLAARTVLAELLCSAHDGGARDYAAALVDDLEKAGEFGRQHVITVSARFVEIKAKLLNGGGDSAKTAVAELQDLVTSVDSAKWCTPHHYFRLEILSSIAQILANDLGNALGALPIAQNVADLRMKFYPDQQETKDASEFVEGLMRRLGRYSVSAAPGQASAS